MQQYQLQRTNGPAVCFRGEIRAESYSAPEKSGKDGWRVREHAIRVYQSDRVQTWIVEVEYNTTWRDEHSTREVHVLRAMDDRKAVEGIRSTLERHDPTASIAGYPAADEYAARQLRLLAWHRAEWKALCARLMAQLPGSAERVDEDDDTRARVLERSLECALDLATALTLDGCGSAICEALRQAQVARQDREMHEGTPVTVEESWDTTVRALDVATALPTKCDCGEPCDRGHTECPVCESVIRSEVRRG